MISDIVQKSTFLDDSYWTLSLDLFAPPTSLIFQSPLTSLSYDLYSVLDNQKALKKNIFQATTFKDFSRTPPKMQGLFKIVRALTVSQKLTAQKHLCMVI